VRERRTGGPSGRTLKQGMVLVPKIALVAAQADPLGAADPLIPLRDGGERGAPQPEAHHLEHPRQAQAEAEKWVAPSGIWQAEPPQILAKGGALSRAGARANITKLPAFLLARGVQTHNIRNGKQGQAAAVNMQGDMSLNGPWKVSKKT